MTQPLDQTNDSQAAIVKGKSPRNALVGFGILAAVIIGAIGFYYQVKASKEAADEARLAKKAKQAAVVDSSTDTKSVDQIIADQQAAARRAEAAQRTAKQAPKPVQPELTANSFLNDQHEQNLAKEVKQDSIYTSPIFPTGMKVKEAAQDQAQLPPGIITPQQMALQQQAAIGAANAQAADALAKLGHGGSPAQLTNDQRDTGFIKSVSNGHDFASSGFVGQSSGCTLSPPHHIPVLAVYGLDSDHAGTAALMVDQNVYDSITGACLMIPKGTMITAPYSSDIKPGQERVLVAGAEMRLPNGKHVPLYGAEGADADGSAGFSGHVNNHFLKIYGASFLTAILLGRFDKGDSSSTTSGPYGVTQVGSTAGQVAATTAQSILNRYQNIPATITTAPGERHFMLQVNRDIHLEPYHE